MRERPIIFSGPSVLAISRDLKTQSRRVVALREFGASDTPGYDFTFRDRRMLWNDVSAARALELCPYGRPGDKLWVREAWSSQEKDIVAYRADGECGAWMGDGEGGRVWINHGWIHGATDGTQPGKWYGLGKYGGRWRSPIFMPRWASRLTLELTGVRVERLNSISEDDALAEGARYFPDAPEPRRHPYGIAPPRWSMFSPASTDECMHSAKMAFANGWDHVNGKRAPWSSNPWVWALTFRRLHGVQVA